MLFIIGAVSQNTWRATSAGGKEEEKTKRMA